MKKEKILYQIKSLEKMIFRALIKEKECLEEFSCNHPTPTQMQIMEYIIEHKDKEIFQRDLEEVLNLRRATVSGVLQTMEKNNLIKRVSCLNDARVKKIILNPKTEEIFKEKERKVEEFESIVVEDISEEELVVFSNVLKKMKDNIKNTFDK